MVEASGLETPQPPKACKAQQEEEDRFYELLFAAAASSRGSVSESQAEAKQPWRDHVLKP